MMALEQNPAYEPVAFFMIRSRLDSFYNYVFHQQDLPKWIINLNYGSLIGVAACPLVFLGSLFMWDDPTQDHTNTFLYFVLLNCYSFVLILITFCSFKLFKLSPIISAILPGAVILFYIFLFVKITLIR